MYATMNTHPGEIPLYWGFYIGDEDYKRKRYCLICNAFKPERSHHCSVCNICILNMDHHCPWVNNCIGFYNRKYFMQLLFYVVTTIIFLDICFFRVAYDTGRLIYEEQLKIREIYKPIIILVSYITNIILTVMITKFFQFHISLVLNNITTIESLDTSNPNSKKFSISSYENWVQVFGENKFYWLVPTITERGRPKGDGLTWGTESFIESQKINTYNQNANPAPQRKQIETEMKYNPGKLNAYDSNKHSTNPFSPKPQDT